MEQRLTVLTLGVRDPAASRRFYVDGLGWSVTSEVADEVIFLQIGHGLLLALWRLAAMVDEAGPVSTPTFGAPAPVTLGHNVFAESEVTEVLNRAVAAGGALVAPATRRSWGGLSGYFADPDGYRWEVVHNPGLVVADDGSVAFG